MADPRTTGLLDDFASYAAEDPLSHGGMWDQTFSNRDPMEKGGSCAIRRETHTTIRAYSYYTPTGWTGDLEVWGQRCEGGFLLGHQEILGFVTGADGGLAVGQWDGYAVWSHQQVSDNYLYLYRVDNGGNTQLDRVANDDNWVMMRRTGTLVEVWAAPTGVDDWVLVIQESDNTYTSDLWITLGEGDNNNSSHAQTGWRYVGGGINVNRPQFYRWIKN